MAHAELRHLATLTAVVVEGSFGRAASRLGYTQSTVSQHVAALERAVGGRLFDRPGGPRRVRLTPLGEVTLAHAAELLAKADAMHTAIERFKAGEGRITIGTFQSVSTTLLPVLIRRLRDEFPGCDIRLSEDEVGFADPSAVDLLFYDHRVPGDDVEYLKLLDDPYHLVAPRGRFPDGPVDLARLDGAPMVAWPPDCAQPALEEALAADGVHPEIVFRAAGNEVVLSMVRAGLGSAILPRLVLHTAGAMADEALSVHALRPPIAPREIYLVRRAHRTPSPLAARAARLAQEIAGELESDR
ncbi:LysR family transcriptional regulator [Sphaerisporangium sp. TRM90804]|uniref:LysR family transcriptional regulator n=1 Tax=Sphaerisporangium sp. TRM90804 TaxID=3031113 RepID=UPI00244B8E96|nr:LysR family transcriptional regulator [Sphaerisporangium sp. TRM90804]MDH2426517.1 LysR family transcriptional regulator [Sphaerisporangium sp. TRM90804]